jgi:prolyl-tRNA synthetase
MTQFDNQGLPNKFGKKELKKKSENISDWYTDVVLKAELADYGPVRGTMIIRPYGYAIWELLQAEMDKRMKAYGIQNAAFPLFIPYSFLQKEKKHVEGFSPELALVTVGGGEELKEPLVVRPTSETIMYDSFSKWINSWRDLPVMINQWNSVVRWEKRTFLFLRSMEFFWHEAHTAHEDEQGAVKMCLDAQEWYREMYEEYLAIPVIPGTKSDTETFAGAKRTYTVEALLPDGRALQGATSHNLAQNFAKAFEVTFQDREGKTQYVWQTSYAITTRALGALFMMHGDDSGLVLPPKIAPHQVIIIPIANKETGEVEDDYINEISGELSKEGIRVHVDYRDTQTPGRKFNEWEMKGVPVRFEVGKNEARKKTITVVRRDTGEKYEIDHAHVLTETQKVLDQIQKSLFNKAKKFLDENTHDVSSYDEFKKIMETTRGFLECFWCENAECETKIKEETKATTRCKPISAKPKSGTCIYCGKEAKYKWYFAQAY